MTNLTEDSYNNKWAKVHTVFSLEITRRLIHKLGYFQKVDYIRSVSRCVGFGYKNHIYVIDEKWQVTVISNIYNAGKIYDTYAIEDYTNVLARTKAFGKRAAKLAREAEVPWALGIFVGYVYDDNEAISILKQIKSVRGTANKTLRRELKCGIRRRKKALKSLLGKTWKKIYCCGYNQTKILADYLLGE